MSLSRAFTTRRWKNGTDSESSGASSLISMPKRSNTTKGADFRPKISAPVQLLHTTNMLSYNAPDLPRASRSNSASSKSGDDSDAQTNLSTPPTSPDVSPVERCDSPAPEPNHLSCYFQTAGQQTKQSPDLSAPAIPKRSPSHTKKASYEALARKHSVSRMSRDSEHSATSKPGRTFSRASSTSTRASSASHMSTPLGQKPTSTPTTPVLNKPTKEQHPFGQELAQVSELAEEYGAGQQLNAIVEEEEQYLEAHGLVKLSADDYLGAIQGLAAAFFPDMKKHTAAPAPLWI